MGDIVMKIPRSEYRDLTNKVTLLTAENEELKKENDTLKNKLNTVAKKTENKKKEADK